MTEEDRFNYQIRKMPLIKLSNFSFESEREKEVQKRAVAHLKEA